MSDLPEGYTLDELPAGYSLDARSAPVIAPMVNSPTIGPGPRTSQMPDMPLPARPWGDVANYILPSIGKAAGNVYDAFRHPLDTGQNLVKLGVGALENLPHPYMTPQRQADIATANPQMTQARAEDKAIAGNVGDYLGNRYGGLDKLRETMITDPAGFLMDASTASPAAGATLPGKLGAAASTAGKLIDPATIAGNALKLPTKYVAEPLAAHALGLNTGMGTRAVRDIGSAGRELGSGIDMADGFIPKTGDVVNNAAAVVENMNKGAPVMDLVGRAKNALADATRARGAAYRAGMKEVGEIEKPIPFQPIEDALNDANKVKNFNGVQLDPSATATKNQIADTVQAWKDLDPNHPLFKDATEALTPENYHTPVGLDALKQLVGDIRATTDHGTPSRAVADRVYNSIGSEIRKAAPEYDSVMAKYGSASGKLGETARTFSLGERATGDTAARKLLSATNTGVGGTFLNRQRLLDELAQHDSTLPYAIAGQAAQAVMPRGVVARGGLMAHSVAGGGLAALLANPLTALAAIPTMATFSPRIVGNVVHYGGRAVGTVDDIAKALRITPDAVRAMERGGYQAGQNNALQGNPYLGAR